MNREEILALIKQKEAEARNEDITAEQRSALMEEIKGLKRDLKNTPEPQPEPEPAPAPNYRRMDVFHDMDNNITDDIYSSREYRNAWFESVRCGSDDYVRRFISTNDSGSSQGGAVLVPTMLENTIEHAVRHGGSIISLCNITAYPGLTSIPYEIDEGEEGKDREEGASGPAESEIELGEVSLKPSTIVKWISITKEMETMAIDAFADYVTNLLVERILAACDKKVLLNAKGDKGLNGIDTVADTKIVASIKESLRFGTGFNAQAELDDNVDAVCIMHKKTFFNTVMQMKDTTGQPIFKSMIDPTTGKAVYYYNGMLVKFANDLPEYSKATEDQTYMVVGDFKGYRANFPNGFAVSLLRDPYTLGVDGKIRYIADIMAGGNVTKLLHFCTVKKSAA